jgi:hypothetical protein
VVKPAGDVVRVAVLSVGQVALDDRFEARFAKVAAEQPVHSGGVAADRGGRQDATGTKHAMPLGQRPDPVGAFGEVVERAQQQHRIDAGVGSVQHTRIAPGDPGQARHASGLLDVQRHRIDQVDLISQCGQRLCVDTGGAAHIEHNRRFRR